MAGTKVPQRGLPGTSIDTYPPCFVSPVEWTDKVKLDSVASTSFTLTQLPEQKGGPQPFSEQHVVGRGLKATRLNTCLGISQPLGVQGPCIWGSLGPQVLR